MGNQRSRGGTVQFGSGPGQVERRSAVSRVRRRLGGFVQRLGGRIAGNG